MDARGIPTCSCPNCGGMMFRALVMFDPETYTVGMYHLDLECDYCGTKVTAPTPIDLPNGDKNGK